jgi:uncharacterized protein (TIGR02117 family)
MKGRAARMMRRAALVFLGLAAAAGLAAFLGTAVPRPLVPVQEEIPPEGVPARRVLVLANPIHTDIALPADADVLARFSFLGDDGLPMDWAGVEWLVFGWGGRSFYLETPTWGDLRPGPVVRAFTLDRSAMHVSVAGPIGLPQEGVLALDLAEGNFERLVEGIEAGFMRSGQGEPILIEGRSYGDYDLFYEGAGRFNALAGCNLWSAAALRAGGLRTGWWNPLPASLVWSLRRHNPSANGHAMSVSGSQP